MVRDWLYSGFRWLVRQKAGLFLAKSLHPEILYHFCVWLSGTSRKASRDESALIESRARELLTTRPGDWTCC